ncbi:hypothetical protein BV22DRAFT_1196995, partial [Leucogyrophana mollusca]
MSFCTSKLSTWFVFSAGLKAFPTNHTDPHRLVQCILHLVAAASLRAIWVAVHHVPQNQRQIATGHPTLDPSSHLHARLGSQTDGVVPSRRQTAIGTPTCASFSFWAGGSCCPWQLEVTRRRTESVATTWALRAGALRSWLPIAHHLVYRFSVCGVLLLSLPMDPSRLMCSSSAPNVVQL